MSRLMQDGDWRLIHVYEQYRILNRCYEAAFSCAGVTDKKAWAAVGDWSGVCIACAAAPPDEMKGMVALCKWER